jgi:hypothetical protein
VKDKYGVEVEVGDIVVSSGSSQYGKMKVGPVRKLFPSGRVTMEYEYEANVYAYQEGAPDIPTEGERAKRDEFGNAVREYNLHGQYWAPYVYEKYTYMAKDYTVVGKKLYRQREQAAERNIIVIRKADGSVPERFNKYFNWTDGAES